MRISDWSSDVCSSDLACYLLHDAEAEHVDDQIVVAEAGAAIAEDDLFVAGFAELLDDVADLARAEELRFLDVDDAAGFCERHHEVGLSREKGRELQNVDDFGDWRGLPGFVHGGRS